MNRPQSARRRTQLIVVLAAGAAMLAGGCSVAAPSASNAPPPTATTPPASSSPTPSAVATPPRATPLVATSAPSPSVAWAICANSHVGYEIAYPAGWFTTSLRPEEVCTQFDPKEFMIPVDSEYPLTALMVHGSPDPLDAYPLEDDPNLTVLLREDTTVNGRRAIRYEVRFSAEAMYGDGTMRYGYQVDWDGGVFEVFSMADPGVSAGDYAAWKAIVDYAVRSAHLD
jgi:hypothetical protein